MKTKTLKKVVVYVFAFVMFAAYMPVVGYAKEDLQVTYLPKEINDMWEKEVIEGKYVYTDYAKLKNGKYRIIDQLIAMPLNDQEYDQVGRYGNWILPVSKGNKWGAVNNKGELVIPYKFDHLKNFSEGFAVFGVGKEPNIKYGYVDTKGNVVIQPTYDYACSFSEDLAAVGNIDAQGILKFGFIDKSGKLVIPMRYEANDYGEDIEFNDGLAWVYIEEKSKSEGTTNSYIGMFIDKTGKKVFDIDTVNAQIDKDEEKIDELGSFSEGLAVTDPHYPGDDHRYGWIDTTGKLVIPFKYNTRSNFINGLAPVGLLLSYEPYDMKYGYIDKNGKEVIPCKYDDVYYFYSAGFAYVKKGKDILCIDRTGKEYPLASLPNKDAHMEEFFDNNILIKYMGKWGFVNSDTLLKPEIQKMLETNVAPAQPKPATPAGMKAVPTASKVLVNAKDTAFDAYNIEGNNYFKLRDIAAVLTETDKKFEVSWDEKAQAISITTKKAYTKVGGEMAAPATMEKMAVKSNAKILIDGKEVMPTAYNINGNNYFKLRDLGKALKFGVDWDENVKSISVDTSKDYSEK